MSRNSKNARNLALAKQISAQRKSGNPGPAKTTAAHGKKWGYRDNPESQKRLAEAIKTVLKHDEKTSGKRILASSGGAATTIITK